MRRFRVLMVLLLSLTAMGSNSWGQFFQPAQEELFLMAPRPLMRLLREGEEAIAEGRYVDAVNALQAILVDEDDIVPADLRGQDFFIEMSAGGNFNKSLKGEALRLLSQLPPDGRQALELQLGVTAAKLLEKALNLRDLELLSEVARKYSQTNAGYDAQVLLAQARMAEGFPLAAAGIFQNLLDSPPARERFGGQLAFVAAVAWMQADRREMALKTIQLAVRDFSGSSVTVNGQQIPIDAKTNWTPVLENASGAAILSSEVANAWLQHGGSAERNAYSDAGLPLPNARWVADINSSAPERDALLDVAEAQRKARRVIVPRFELRMIADNVITRMTNGSVISLDFETGRTKWGTFLFGVAASLQSFSSGNPYRTNDVGTDELNNRVWGSSAFGRFSCDPQRLYTIVSDNQTVNAFRGSTIGSFNSLEACSIEAEGALLWRVGGEDGADEPLLARSFFLGAPLVYEGQLYAIVEINGETKLVVLEPSTGKLQWVQQLAHAVSRPIDSDPMRQSQALSPTIAEGVVLCPTGVGGVVAVDLLSRTLRWGLTYRMSNYIQNRGGFSGFSEPEYDPLEDRWLDSGLIADRGVVVISPPEFDRFFCRDILSGSSVLRYQDRRQFRYVAGIHDGDVVSVGETGLKAIRLADQQLAWETDYPEGLTLAGQGLWKQDSMLLPLSNQTIIEVRLEDGEIIGTARVDHELGNLFAYRGQLLSVNSHQIAAYYTKESLRTLVDERLANNDQDAWALSQKAQLLRAEGDTRGAIELLLQSFKIDDNNAETNYLLIESMISALQTDFEEYAELASEIDDIVEYGPQRIRFLRQLTMGLIETGNYVAAFERLLEMMRNRVKETYSGSQGFAQRFEFEDRLSIDLDMWITAELAKAYEAADPAERLGMDRLVAAEVAAVDSVLIPLKHEQLKYLSWLPSAGAATLELAKSLRGSSDQTLAEHILQPLLHVGGSEFKNAALEVLAEPTPADANEFLRNEVGFAASFDGAVDIEDKASGAFQWKSGATETKIVENKSIYVYGDPIAVSSQRYGRPEISVSLSDARVILSNKYGKEVAFLDVQPASGNMLQQFNRATIRGGLLLIESASEITAFDIYQGIKDPSDALLWRYSLVEASVDERFRDIQEVAGMEPLGISTPRRSHDRNYAIQVGPLTAVGVVVQNGTSIRMLHTLTGRTLWTRSGYSDDVRIAHSGLQIALVNPDEGSTEIIDCRDGSLIERKDFRGERHHALSFESLLVDREDLPDNAGYVVRAWNPFTDETVCEIELPLHAEGATCQGTYVILADPTKQELHYIDLKRHRAKTHSVAIARGINALAAESFGDQILVMQDAARGSQPIKREVFIDGNVYALDADTGELLWDSPGRMSVWRMPVKQPRQSPFMVSYTLNPKRDETTSYMRASLVVVDTRDGRIAYSSKDFNLNEDQTQFEMILKQPQQAVEFQLGDRLHIMSCTDAPRAPQPVVHFESPRN